MRKSSMIRIGMVVFCLSLLMGLWSCGSNNNSDPVPKPAALSTATFHDPPLLLMMSGEEEVGLFSWLTELVTEGLREGATIFVADKTTGWILNYVSDKLFGSETDRALAEMNAKLDEITHQLKAIEDALDALQGQLLITKVELKNYLGSNKISTAIAQIQSAYSSQDNAGLVGLTSSARSVNKSDPAAVTRLQDDVRQYAKTYRYSMHEDIQLLHDAICPATSNVDGILKDYADQVILTGIPGSKLSNPANAMAAYKALETFFSQVLNYQTKALMILSEINNYLYPDGSQTTEYFTKTYTLLLKDEIARYQWTVNYLMVNMMDYRTKENFNADSAYLEEGLARDDVFLQVFARSRFFTAQLLEGIGEPTYTLHGAIIIPRYYSPQGEDVQYITLQLDGPNNTRFTKQVKASHFVGRFPYTKWTGKKASPDKHWSFYDFNFNDMTNDIPIGTYKITLVDNGDKNTPWFHTTTDLGQVSVKYYDPQTFTEIDLSKTKTLPPNAIKFGAFSGRWNWGYCRLSSSPISSWVIPEKTTTRKKDNPELLKGTRYSPHKSTAGQINQLSLSLDQILYSGTKYVEYSLNLPFSVSRAPGDGKTVSASMFYSHGGHVMLDNPDELDAYLWYRLIDTTNNSRQDITSQYTTNFRSHPEYGPYYHQFDTINEDFPTRYGTNSKLSIRPDIDYKFDVDAELAFTAGLSHSQAYAHASLNAYWNMQLVYMNTYDIF